MNQYRPLEAFRPWAFAWLVLCAPACGSDDKGASGGRMPGAFYLKGNFGTEPLAFAHGVSASVFDETNWNHLLLVANLNEERLGAANFPNVSFEVNLPDTDRISQGIYREADVELIFRHSLSGTKVLHSQSGDDLDFSIEVTEPCQVGRLERLSQAALVEQVRALVEQVRPGRG